MSNYNNACFPNKLKKQETGPLWRRKEDKNSKHHQKRSCYSSSPTRDRPTILLPPMQWSNTAEDPSSSSTTAPVVSTRVQDLQQTAPYVAIPAPSLQATPSAPSPGEVFYNSEDQADMEFIVEAEAKPEEWRFPMHSFILNKREATLQTLLETAEPFVETEKTGDPDHKEKAAGSSPTAFRLRNLQPEVFEQIHRYIYTRQLSLSSVESALRLLQPSQTYQLPELTTECLLYISKNLTPSKVLTVLSHLLRPCPENQKARTSISECHDNDNLQNELVFLCFQMVDCHADAILQSEEFENLEHEVMVAVVKRDTLEVSSEAIVFDAIMRWACRACKRQRKKLTSDNKSEVLGKALFLVRYLLMTPEEFLSGPMSQGVLSKEDKEALLSRISEKTPSTTPVPLPEHWTGWKISVKRQNRNRLAVTSPSSDKLSNGTNASTSPTGSVNRSATERKKKSLSKKLLNGVGDLVICVIHMLD